MIKTNKSFLKRVKLTKGNKVMKRPPNQGHFNAKASGNESRRKHGEVRAPKEMTNMAKALLSSHRN